MSEVQDQLDVERLNNLIRGFGWNLVKQEFLTGKIVLQIEKARVSESLIEGGAGGPG